MGMEHWWNDNNREYVENRRYLQPYCAFSAFSSTLLLRALNIRSTATTNTSAPATAFDSRIFQYCCHLRCIASQSEEIYSSGRACWLHISDTSLYTIHKVLGINIGLYGRIVRPNHLVFVVETKCVIFAVIPAVTMTISLPSSRMCTVCCSK